MKLFACFVQKLAPCLFSRGWTRKHRAHVVWTHQTVCHTHMYHRQRQCSTRDPNAWQVLEYRDNDTET